MMMYGNGWNMTSGWGWIGMTVMMLVWFGLLALLIYAVSRAFWGPGRSASTSRSDEDRAMNVLRERFARGEITETEYDQARNVLIDKAS